MIPSDTLVCGLEMAEIGENIVINVAFESTNLSIGPVNEIQVVPSDIAWEDLELMLKVYAGHDETDQLVVKYRDDDHDEITIGTQEELQEAFKVARKSNNTLQLRVLCDVSPDIGIQEGNMVIKANVMTQSVSMATTNVGTDGAAAADKPDVVPFDDAAMTGGEDKEDDDIQSVIMEPENEKGSTGDIDDCIIVDVKNAEDDTIKSANPVEPPVDKSKHLFYIKNKASGLVLDINGGNPSPGINIITWTRKAGNGPDTANQLWYWEGCHIKSALNHLCMQAAEGAVVMAPPSQHLAGQQWRITDGQIHNCSNRSRALVTPANQPGISVHTSQAQLGSPNAEWEIEYIDQGKKKVCTNKETGEHVQCVPNKGCRPKAAKRGKKDHYAELAKEVGREIFGKAHSSIQLSPKKRLSTGTEAAMPEDCPPWFFKYMDKFKKEITDDMANLVACKTVHQVLKGLNNAVIDTVKITQNGQVVPGGAIPKSAAQSEAERPASYCHDGVVCDHCDKMIVGIRYKCGNCEDFDLCEDCEASHNSHDPEHVFLKIRRPVATAGRRKNGRMIPLLKTNLYKAEGDRIIDEKPQKEEKLKRKEEKLLQKFERLEEKMRRKEEKMKRRLEASKETPQKKEKLDLPQTAMLVDLMFISDENIPDGTHVQPNTRLTKKWLVKNTGNVQWNDNFELAMMWGNMSPVKSEVSVPGLQPEEQGVVTVEVLAPSDPGIYQSHWRLSYKGRRYGHRVWCSIVVDPKETLEPICEDTTMLNMSRESQTEATPEVPQASAPVITMESKALSEPPSPAPRGLMDSQPKLHHVTSYETLDISNRPRARASQTATPNNTPRAVTPPKSPVTELCGLSTSSSVEVVTVDPEDEGMDEETMSRMTELVQERMASLGLKPNDREDDLDSWSSYEDDLSEDTDSDFYVVPIPDCFNPELPAVPSASTSIYVKKDEAKSIDQILRTSHSLETEPLLKPSSTTNTPVPADGSTKSRDASTYEPIMGNTDDENDDVIIVKMEEPPVASVKDPVPKEVVADGAICQPEVEGATGAVDNGAICQPEVEGATGAVDDGAICPPEVAGTTGAVDVMVEEQGTDPTANLPLDINDNSAGTPNQEGCDSPTEDPDTPRVQTSQAESQDPREISPSPGELASHMVSAARGMASMATLAAQSAYSTARDVFHTLQARDRYVPPTSNWSPPAQEWTPPQDEWSPPAQEWTPPQDEWSPPAQEWTPPQDEWSPPAQEWTPVVESEVPDRQLTNMEQLIEMGFADREKNKRLLKTYADDLDKVISALVNESEDWSNQRH